MGFTYTVTDGSLTVAGTANLDIMPVNDAPTTSTVTLAAIAEDSGVRLITQAQLLANAADIDGPSMTATGLAIATGSGTLVDNGNGTWNYTPAADDDTAMSFTYTVTDGSLTAAGTANLDITPVNDAPTLASGASVALTATDENTPSTPATIDTLLAASAWADVDSAALKGIAVTGATGNGSWQYSTNAVTWRGFGSVSGGNALLLDANTQVRYVPGSGAANATFAFQAWDQTSGAAATNALPSYVNPGAGGGSSAFSLAAGSVRVTVAAVPAIVVPPVVLPTDPNPSAIPPTPAQESAPPTVVPPLQTVSGTAVSGRPPGIIGAPGSAVAGSAAALEQAIASAILKDNSLSFAPPSVRLVAANVVAVTHPFTADAPNLNEWDFSTIDFRLNALLRAPAAESSNWSPPGAVLGFDPGAGTNGDEASGGSRPLLSFENGVKFSGALATAGFVAWALRSAGIMTTLLVSMPAWRHLDPIPVLSPDEAKPDWERDASDEEHDKQDHDAQTEAAVSELLRRDSA